MNAGFDSRRLVAICGGIGGAKLALGLATVVPPDRLTIVVNTGDDFEHLGLHVSPDIDTVLYTLAGLANRTLGWGLEGETWRFMEGVERLGGPTWFRLGDQDLATHVLRTSRLAGGDTLTAVTEHLRRQLGVAPAVVPMSDDPVRTFVDTPEGRLPFQTYFVGRRAEPAVRAIGFDGADRARPSPAALAAVARDDLAGIVICPSNPWLSIDPLLAVPGWRAVLSERRVPCVAVSPLVGGRAIKGPTAKIMGELGLPLTNAAIVEHYRGVLDGLVIDTSDAGDGSGLGVPTHICNTVMQTLDDRARLATDVLEFCRRLADGFSSGARA